MFLGRPPLGGGDGGGSLHLRERQMRDLGAPGLLQSRFWEAVHCAEAPLESTRVRGSVGRGLTLKWRFLQGLGA